MENNNIQSVKLFLDLNEILEPNPYEDWEYINYRKEFENKLLNNNHLPFALFRELRLGAASDDDFEKMVSVLNNHSPEVLLLNEEINHLAISHYLSFNCSGNGDEDSLWIYLQQKPMPLKKLYDDVVDYSGDMCKLFNSCWLSLNKKQKENIINIMKSEEINSCDYYDKYPLTILIIKMNNKNGLIE